MGAQRARDQSGESNGERTSERPARGGILTISVIKDPNKYLFVVYDGATTIGTFNRLAAAWRLKMFLERGATYGTSGRP